MDLTNINLNKSVIKEIINDIYEQETKKIGAEVKVVALSYGQYYVENIKKLLNKPSFELLKDTTERLILSKPFNSYGRIKDGKEIIIFEDKFITDPVLAFDTKNEIKNTVLLTTTLYHEFRHAFQQYAYEKNLYDDYANAIIYMETMLSQNIKDYRQNYKINYLEIDAESYAQVMTCEYLKQSPEVYKNFKNQNLKKAYQLQHQLKMFSFNDLLNRFLAMDCNQIKYNNCNINNILTPNYQLRDKTKIVKLVKMSNMDLELKQAILSSDIILDSYNYLDLNEEEFEFLNYCLNQEIEKIQEQQNINDQYFNNDIINETKYEICKNNLNLRIKEIEKTMNQNYYEGLSENGNSRFI